MSNSITANKNLSIQTFNTSDGTLPTSAVLTSGLTSGTTYLTWDVPENYNAAALDVILGGTATVSVTGASGTVALTADKYQPMVMLFTGTLTASVIYTIPSGVGGTWVVRNSTTGSFTITLSSLTAGASATFAVPQDGLPYTVSLIAVSGGGFYIGTITDGSITTAKIADSAVTTAKLNNYSITNTKLLPSVINSLSAKTTLANADEFSIYDSAAVVAISTITMTGGGPTYTATATTAASHGLSNGDSLTISGATGNTSVNGVFTITVTSTTQFTYTATSNAAVTGSPVYILNPGLKKITYLNLLAQLVPTGTVNSYAGAAAPAGWLLCFGQAVSRTTYASLFAVIGTTYGAGDTTTTFNLPDLRGRVIAGQDDMGGTSANRLTNSLTGGVDGDVLGGTGGNEGNTLITSQIPSHTHTYGPKTGRYGANDQGYPTNEFQPSAGDSDRGSQTMTSDATGGGLAHNNVQPTIVLNYIIKE
jgi:microcystin-dependent protein